MVATIQADERIERMALAARDNGMPIDQTRRFIESGTVVLPAMMGFHAAAREADLDSGPDEIALGGSRGPGKSFAAMAQVGIDDCQRAPELKVLFLRKIMKSAAESLDDLVRKTFRYLEHRSNTEGVKFPNGSRILVGGYHDPNDIDKYLGIEYDVIVIEEATQLIEDKKDKIKGSLRTTRHDWRARMYLTTNADGPGLKWFKQTYVIPWREGKQKWTRFFQVDYQDNPFLKADYIRWLEGLKGALGKAWRDSDWDAFKGMAFPIWNQERHVVDPYEIPESWYRWRATDEGYAAPWCTLWGAKNPSSGQIVVYREAYERELTLSQQADRINDMTLPGEKIGIHYADPAMWQTKNRNGKTFASKDEYKEHGIHLTQADNDRIQGKRKVDDALADLPNGEPGLVMFSHVTNLAEQLATLALDDHNPEDVDTTQEDHAYDTVRYLLTNKKRIPAGPPETAEQQAKRTRNPAANLKGI